MGVGWVCVFFYVFFIFYLCCCSSRCSYLYLLFNESLPTRTSIDFTIKQFTNTKKNVVLPTYWASWGNIVWCVWLSTLRIDKLLFSNLQRKSWHKIKVLSFTTRNFTTLSRCDRSGPNWLPTIWNCSLILLE